MNIPNLLIASLFLGLFFSLPLLAEVSQYEAKVVGEVSDGKPAPPLPKPALPQYRVHWGQVQQKKDHKVFINRVEAPAEPLKQPMESPDPLEDLPMEQPENQITHGGTFFVFATTYDGHSTRVRWHHNGEEFIVWSNVNWKYLCGFSSFEGRGKRYDFLMLHNYATAKQARQDRVGRQQVKRIEIPSLPSLTKTGARYMVMQGDEGNDDAMEFIEAIHDLYEAEKVRLVSAYQERQKNGIIQQARNEELRRNPPPKPDVIINYWKRHTPMNANQKAR